MNALLILIPVSLVLLGIAIWAFFWAVDRGQFDDLDTPALRILEDDAQPESAADTDEPGAGSASPRTDEEAVTAPRRVPHQGD